MVLGIFRKLLQNLFSRLDVLFSILGIIFGSIILILSYFNIFQQLFVGFFLLLISVIHLLIKNNYPENPYIHINLLKNDSLFSIIYVVLFFASIYNYFINLYFRSELYFILIGLLGILIYIEILNGKKHIKKIIVEILLLSLNLKAGIFYLFPSIMGVDAYRHLKIIEYLATFGHMPSMVDSYTYYFYPIFHIYVTSFYLVINSYLKDSYFISIGIVSTLLSIFIYFMVKKLINVNAGLISLLLFNLVNVNLLYNIANITPQTYVVLIYLIMVYIIFIKHSKYDYYVLSFLSFILILTHQLSTFVVLLSLVVMYLTKYIYSYVNLDNLNFKNAIKLNQNYIFYFISFLSLYWITVFITSNYTFFDYVFRPLINDIRSGITVNPDQLLSGRNIGNYYSVDYYVLTLNYLVLPILAIGGSFLWLRSRDIKKIVISFSFLLLFGVSYILPLSGYNNFLTDRWLPLIYIFVAPLSVYYLLTLTSKIRIKHLNVIFSILIVAFIIGSSIISPSVNKDNSFFLKDSNPRTQYKLSEILPLSNINSKYQGDITIDSNFIDCFTLYYYPPSQFTIDLNSTIFNFNDNFTKTNQLVTAHSLIIFRSDILKEIINIGTEAGSEYGTISYSSYNYLNTKNRVYDNNHLIGYIT